MERELFAKPSFQKAIRETFIKAGQAAASDGTFVQYKSHERQTIASFLLREGKPEDSSLATLTGPAVDVVPYQEDEEPETDEEDEADADE